jgi:hypothetical protein
MRTFLLLILLLSLSFNNQAQAYHTAPNHWKEPRIYHEPFEKDASQIFPMETVKCKANPIGATFSPNKAYWFRLDDKTGKNISFILSVFNDKGCIQVSLDELYPNFSPPKINWINEKLLYVELWWGRILGAYFILDVEKARIITAEELHDGTIDFQQWHDACKNKELKLDCVK